MGHGITTTDNFAFTGERTNIWHRMGLQIKDGQKAVEALPSIGLDWDTELLPVYADFQGNKIELPESRAHVRKDNGALLGLVSSGYKPVDNGDLARFADGVAEQGATVSTAGSLLGGKRVFVTMQLPKVIVAGKDDAQYQYLVVSNGHGGFAAFSTYLTSVRVVCQNTLNLSERDISTGTRFYHTGNMEAKLRQARLIMGFATAEVEKYEQQVKALANADLSVGQVKDFLLAAFTATFGEAPETGSEAYDKWLVKRDGMVADWLVRFEGEKQILPGIQGTAWAAFNAYTEWSDHNRGGKWMDNRGEDARTHSNVFGVSAVAKRKVFQLALGSV